MGESRLLNKMGDWGIEIGDCTVTNKLIIYEHRCGLWNLPEDGFRFHTAPVQVKAFGTFPVRAYAVPDA